MKSYYVVSFGYQRVEAISARAAADVVAAQKRVGERKDAVVRTEREALALLSMIGGQRGAAKAKGRP